MLNVLALTEGFPYGNGLAGVFHADQFREMAARGVNLTVVGPTPLVPPGLSRFTRWQRYDAGPARQEVDGFTVLRPRYPAFPGEARWLRPHWLQYLAVRRLGLPRPDLIHGFFALPLGATARLLARHWEVPYVVTCLGGDVTRLAQQSGYHQRLFRGILSDARVAMANGPSLARQAGKLAGIPVRPCPLGVDGARFTRLPGKQTARAELGLPGDKAVVLFVGGLSAAKGVGELLQAMQQIPDDGFCCVLVGGGVLEQAAAKTVRCLTVGQQPNHRIPAYLAAADMLVLPSHSEGLPTVVVEAGLAGVPVIGSDIPPLVDLLDEGRGIIVPVGDAAALARAIVRFRNDRTAAADCARRLGALAHGTYEVAPAVTNLLKIYGQVLAGTRTRNHAAVADRITGTEGAP